MKYLNESENVKTQTVFQAYVTISKSVIDTIEGGGLAMIGDHKWVRGKAGQVTVQVYDPENFIDGSIWKVLAEIKYFPGDKIHKRITFSNWTYQKEQMPELIDPITVEVEVLEKFLGEYTEGAIFANLYYDVVYSAVVDLPSELFDVNRIAETEKYVTFDCKLCGRPVPICDCSGGFYEVKLVNGEKPMLVLNRLVSDPDTAVKVETWQAVLYAIGNLCPDVCEDGVDQFVDILEEKIEKRPVSPTAND